VIRGLSDLHLRVNIDRLKDRHGVEVTSRPPRIAYRETVAGKAEGHHRHKKQTGGAGQFCEVFLRVEPLPRGTGFEFVDEVKGGTIPGQFIPAVEKGVREVLASGAIAGYPVVDVRVVVYDCKHHSVDSKEVAFVTAGRKAFLAAVREARTIVLGPIVQVEITAPESALCDITCDLSSRRGMVSGTGRGAPGTIVVRGQAPMSELLGYQSRLNALTSGQGRFLIDFAHYEPVPPNTQQQLVGAFRSREE
jgi:elongation factor G